MNYISVWSIPAHPRIKPMANKIEVRIIGITRYIKLKSFFTFTTLNLTSNCEIWPPWLPPWLKMAASSEYDQPMWFIRKYEEVFKNLKYNKSNSNESINTYDSSSVIFGNLYDGIKILWTYLFLVGRGFMLGWAEIDQIEI